MEGHQITLQFLQDFISQIEPDVSVLSFKVSPAAGRGDNYTSMIYRVLMTGTVSKEEKTKEWQRSLIYKRLPDSLAHRELYRSDILFQNEVSFYKKAFTSLTEFQRSLDIRKPFSAVPKCFLAKDDVLVLEDLKERGFVIGNRKKGLDYEHCLAVFREIGKFHALSLAMKCHDPVTFHDNVSSTVQETFFTQQNEEHYREYYTTLTKNALAMVEGGLQESEKPFYLDKFKEFLDEKKVFKTMMKLTEPSEPLAVLAHGDFWTSNIMFRYSENGTIEEVCFVDFQCVRYCSPALDLVNFLYSCTPRELRQEHTSTLLAEYCSAISDSLTSMNCGQDDAVYCNSTRLPHLMEEEIKKYSLFGLGQALDMIPISTCDSALAPDLYETETGFHEAVTPFGSEFNPECQRRMTELVIDLVDQGYL